MKLTWTSIYKTKVSAFLNDLMYFFCQFSNLFLEKFRHIANFKINNVIFENNLERQLFKQNFWLFKHFWILFCDKLIDFSGIFWWIWEKLYFFEHYRLFGLEFQILA